MKKALVFWCFFVCLGSLLGLSEINKVSSRGYGNAAYRIVVELNSPAFYRVEGNPDKTVYRLFIDNATASSEKIALVPNFRTVQSITAANTSSGAVLTISCNSSCSYLSFTLSNPYRIVLDLMSEAGVDKAGRLDLAAFFVNTGRHSRAERIYNRYLEKDPADAEVLLSRANAYLEIHDTASARKDLQKISSTSPDYAKAQALLANMQDAPKARQNIVALADTTSALIDSTLVDSTLAAPVSLPFEKPQNTALIERELLLQILAILAALILIFILWRSLKKRNKRHKTLITEESDTPIATIEPVKTMDEDDFCPADLPEMENPTLQRMAHKLADKGWKAKEIATELNLDPKVVKCWMRKYSKHEES